MGARCCSCAKISRRTRVVPGYSPLVICGPSGVGKGTLIEMLLKDYQNKFGFSISCTTRQPRQGEVNGKNYYFITEEEYKQRVEKKEFLEHAKVHLNYYGTLKSEVQRLLAEGKICLLEIDTKGAMQIKQTEVQANYVFIKPPSIELLKERLKGRKSETEEQLQVRLQRAVEEIKECDNSGIFQYIIINDELNKAYQTLIETLKKIYPTIL